MERVEEEAVGRFQERGGVWPKDFKLHNVFVQNLIEEAGRGERKAAVCWRNGHAHY